MVEVKDVSCSRKLLNSSRPFSCLYTTIGVVDRIVSYIRSLFSGALLAQASIELTFELFLFASPNKCWISLSWQIKLNEHVNSFTLIHIYIARYTYSRCFQIIQTDVHCRYINKNITQHLNLTPYNLRWKSQITPFNKPTGTKQILNNRP